MLRICQVIIRNNNKNFSAIKSKRCLSTAATQTKVKDETEASKKQNMSFVANLFRGEVESSQIFPYPVVLNDDQREFLEMSVDSLTRFFTDVNKPLVNDANETLDKVTENALWELGAYAFQVPTEYGGMGATNTQMARMGQVIGANDLGIGVVVGAHQSIGFKGILLFGTDKQKAKYLPQVSTGKVHAAFCLTEPSSGSDASSIRTRAVLSADKKHYVLNGSKIWISNGGVAGVMTVFAQTEVLDPKTGKMKDKVSAFIVERGYKGVSNGPNEKKMGVKCSSTTEIFFDDVHVPLENVIGKIGDGFKIAMNILNNGRFGMGCTLSGTMDACIQKAAEHASNRVQFGQKLEEYEGIQEKLAQMSMLQYAVQAVAYMLPGNMDAGSEDYHLEAAISKIFASESAWQVCDEAIQILGGMGYMRETGLEKMLRDIRIFRIFEGTNDILRLFVALTGIQYAGAHLKELQNAFKNPTANLGLILIEFRNRAIRSIGFGGSDLSNDVDPSLKSSAKLCAECIDTFGRTVESLLIKHGKDIVNRQFYLNRLADCTIDIYAMISTLSRATRAIQMKSSTADHERLMTEAWCIAAYDRVQINIRKINHPSYQDLYKKMTTISRTICEHKGVANKDPILS